MGFPSGSEVKASACNVGDPGSIPGSGRSPGEGNGNPLQYSYLENPMDGRAWKTTVHGVAKSWTRLSDFTSLHFTSLHVLLGGGKSQQVPAEWSEEGKNRGYSSHQCREFQQQCHAGAPRTTMGENQDSASVATPHSSPDWRKLEVLVGQR